MCAAHCALHTALHTVRCTLCAAHCALHIVRCTLHTAHCALCAGQLLNSHWLVTTEQVIRYTVDRPTDDISYTIYRKS